MASLNENNFESENKQISESDTFIAPDAKPVCPKCFKPYNPQYYYCPYCDANDTINPLTTYMPYVDIRFIYGFFGKMWNIIWYEKTALVLKRIFCFLLFLIFVPHILVAGGPFVLIRKFAPVSKRDLLNRIFTIIILVLLPLLLLLLCFLWTFLS